MKTLEQGDIGCLENIRHGQSMIRLRLYGYKNADLYCDQVFEENMKELEFWRFESTEAQHSSLRVDLGVQKEYSKGTIVLSIFAPFWFVNKTSRTLHFKVHFIGVVWGVFKGSFWGSFRGRGKGLWAYSEELLLAVIRGRV